MPSATRNTNAYSGMLGSPPGKPNTWLNTSAEAPSVAANDSTLASSSTSGATTARSSTIRTRKITPSTTGMMRLRSRAAIARTSRLIAVVPPTTTASPTVSRRSRSCSTVRSAAGESAASDSVTSSCTRPSTKSGLAAAGG